MWEHIIRTSNSWDLPWILTGDFNAFGNPEEKRGTCTPRDLRHCRRFMCWVNEAGLTDMGFSGPRYTWFRGDSASTHKASRIDRSLCNNLWNISFPNTLTQHLPKFQSDHLPVLSKYVMMTPSNSVSRPFLIEAAWLLHPQLNDFLQASWNTEAALPTSLVELGDKLQQWKTDIFGSTSRKKRMLMARLQGVTNRLANSYTPGLMKLQIKLERELDQVIAQEELFWFQKASEK
ncbi:unnamed protein product [Linum trigynum]|uniref:Endonuclease/exonuclease/phosphatase domain-containing protein n=1 Tax=Linum trigynum TaxID=586398 RepID=A0AAV2D866_9ROSI